MRKRSLAFVTALTLTLSGCGYNDFQRGDEAVKASWSEVVNRSEERRVGKECA